MNDAMFSNISQALKDLDCKSLNETQRESLEVVFLQELIKIDAEQFKDNTLGINQNDLLNVF
jgi:hypothetical protein